MGVGMALSCRVASPGGGEHLHQGHRQPSVAAGGDGADGAVRPDRPVHCPARRIVVQPRLLRQADASACWALQGSSPDRAG